MREILFRGRIGEKGTWRYGDLIYRGHNLPYIRDRRDGRQFMVNPETIGQYTGLKDRNRVRIYEDDVLIWNGEYFKIRFSEAMFYMSTDDSGFGAAFDYFGGQPELKWIDDVEVVGNIHDNPELAQKMQKEKA